MLISKMATAILFGLSVSIAHASPSSLKPVRMAHVTGTVLKSTFGKKMSSEKVCDIDAQIPVYEERGGTGAEAQPTYVNCKTSVNGQAAQIYLNGALSINEASDYGPASKMVSGMMFVSVPGNTEAGTQASAGAGSEDLGVATIKLSLITNNLSAPAVSGQEAFAAYITIHDDAQ